MNLGIRPAQLQYRSLVRHAAYTNSRMQSLRSWRQAFGGIAKGAENLFFLALAASFVGAGEIAIGGFVALGAYKDLLAQAINSLFQATLHHRSLRIHTLQAHSLFKDSSDNVVSTSMLSHGNIHVEDVSYSYGDLDDEVVDSISFRVEHQEFVVLNGQSGSGKSTIVKLIAGQIKPSSGSVKVGSYDASGDIVGLASVLQTDRLIDASIRDNVAFSGVTTRMPLSQMHWNWLVF